jgi:hypothetical protein
LDDPHYLGAKLHVWGDQGPTGYDMTEIADLVYPTMLVFSERMWGRRGSKDYATFQKRETLVDKVPGVTVFDRIPCANSKGVMLSMPREQTMTSGTYKRLTYAGASRSDLEFPMPLTDGTDRGVILSSDSVEVCMNFTRSERHTDRDPTTGKETNIDLMRHGVGLVRAVGPMREDPTSSRSRNDVSHVCSDPLPENRWTQVVIVGEKAKTSVYIDGRLAGDENDQMLCPLAILGSKTGHSFSGKVKELSVYNRAFSPHEIGDMAGIDIPENIAAGCAVTASASDTPYQLTAEKITDGNPNTRWSSAPTNADQWIDIDLGSIRKVNEVTINWQEAYAAEYRIAVSSDGQQWKEVFVGKGHQGITDAAFATASARHLKILMSKPATRWGYSIFKIEAFCHRASI